MIFSRFHAATRNHFICTIIPTPNMEKQDKEFGHEFVPFQRKQNENIQDLSTLSKIKVFVANITVEPLVVCVILPSIMCLLTAQNLYLEKSCRVNLKLDNEICDALTARNESFPNYKIHEATVQKFAANMVIWKNIIQSIFPATLLLFLGSWSDRHLRRKVCIMNCLLGEISNCVTALLSTYFFYELPLQVIILGESLHTFFSGGWHCLFLGVYSYIGNITSEETRTMRMGAIHTIYSVSFCIGVSLSGIFLQNFGFYGK